MKRSSLFVVLALVAISVGCSKRSTEDRGSTHTTGAEVTPFDQGESSADRKITGDLRRLLVADDSLSQDAKNVMIVTKDGVVTLRGRVKTFPERANIEFAATQTPGVSRVEDELTVETEEPQDTPRGLRFP